MLEDLWRSLGTPVSRLVIPLVIPRGYGDPEGLLEVRGDAWRLQEVLADPSTLLAVPCPPILLIPKFPNPLPRRTKADSCLPFHETQLSCLTFMSILLLTHKSAQHVVLCDLSNASLLILFWHIMTLFAQMKRSACCVSTSYAAPREHNVLIHSCIMTIDVKELGNCDGSTRGTNQNRIICLKR